jgi:ABC-type lipoprotein export system ATPase subunit
MVILFQSRRVMSQISPIVLLLLVLGSNIPRKNLTHLLAFLSHRKDIDVPPVLGSAFMDALTESRRDRAKDLVSFEDRLVAEHKEYKEAVSESPLVLAAIELAKKLQIKTGDLSLRVKNASFKVTQRVDPTDQDKSAKQRIETVFNGAPVQTAWSKIARTLQGDLRGMETKETYPMKDVNLFFEQGKTYLVLGAPRSGKSTLLRMIAGILPDDKGHEVTGEVMVNRFNPKSKEVVWSNIVGYIDQIDRLHPYMTVKETCEFAWRCRMGSTHKTPFMGDGPEIDAEINRLDDELYVVFTTLEAYGLTRVKDTFVGDQQTVRGVSGGEKKRVTCAEMSVGGFPIVCMDEISTGLDGTCESESKLSCNEISELLSKHVINLFSRSNCHFVVSHISCNYVRYLQTHW